MSSLRQRATGHEAGISLVEVIIYSALSALLLSVLGGLFYVGFQTQAAAGGRDSATGAAEVVSNSLETGIRNASSVSVDTTNTLLMARAATGDAEVWHCVAWKLTDDHKLVYKTSKVALTATDFSTWTVLAVGAAGPLGGGSAFTIDGTKLSYSLAFTSGTITVPVAGAVTRTAFGPGIPASC